MGRRNNRCNENAGMSIRTPKRAAVAWKGIPGYLGKTKCIEQAGTYKRADRSFDEFKADLHILFALEGVTTFPSESDLLEVWSLARA